MNTVSLPSMHLALRQHTYGAAPTLEHIPTPRTEPGSALVRVALASILSYTKDIYNGKRAYPYPVPLTLGGGAIGHIAALGSDATTLQVGDLVLLDPMIRGRDDGAGTEGNVFLSAIHEGFTDGSRKLMRDTLRDGTYAEFVRWPLENCHVLDQSRLLAATEQGGREYALEQLMYIPRMMVAYGGLGPGCMDIKPGETVVVAPATGAFGSAAVHLCLELGAGRVIAMGRNTTVLEKLKVAAADNAERLTYLPLTGDWEADLKGLQSVAAGNIDVVFDISPAAAQGSGHLKAAIMALRRGGRVCLMGGIIGDIGLPYSKIMYFNIALKGKWMYEPADVKRFIKLVETGIVRLYNDKDGGIKPFGAKCMKKFKLGDWEAAFDEAVKIGSGGFVVFEP